MRISTSGGGGAAYSSPAVANPLTARMHKGINTTADEGQTPIIQHGGGFDDVAHSLRAEGFDTSEDGTGRGTPIVPVAHPIAIQERAVSENPDAGPDGKGWRDDGAAYTLEARQVSQAVAAPSYEDWLEKTKDLGGTRAEYNALVETEAFTFNTTQLTSPQNGQDLGPDKRCHSLAAKDHPPAVAIAFTAKDHGGDAVEGISPMLRAGGHTGSHANAGVMPAIAFDRYNQAETGDVAQTLCSRGNDDGGTAHLAPHLASAWGVRRLTPTECARLQGFPDDWARIPWRGKPAEECPDGPQYKSYGNSMAVNVMGWLGERIEAVRAVEVKGAKDG